MHNTHFDAIYDDCHVLFLVYLPCETGDNGVPLNTVRSLRTVSPHGKRAEF